MTMAFPYTMPTPEGGTLHSPGMTLRDYIASGVAAALCSATDSTGMWMAPVDEAGARIVAERAYCIADAMLAARQEPTS